VSAPLPHGIAREALLLAARTHRPGDERKCRALIELLETCHALRTSLRRELGVTNLTENGFRILALAIHQEPLPVAPATLAAQLNLSRKAVSAVLGRLELSGLVTRTRDENAPRVFAASATPHGHNAYNHAVRCLLDAIARLMSALNPGDLGQLEQACARLRASSQAVPSV
jgi:DNA-binding MarR family transcriptional regulator